MTEKEYNSTPREIEDLVTEFARSWQDLTLAVKWEETDFPLPVSEGKQHLLIYAGDADFVRVKLISVNNGTRTKVLAYAMENEWIKGFNETAQKILAVLIEYLDNATGWSETRNGVKTESEPTAKPAVMAQARDIVPERKKRHRGISPDVIEDCKTAMKYWLDDAKPLAEAAQLAGRDDETVLKRIPEVLQTVDAQTREKWIILIQAQGKAKYLGQFDRSEDKRT